MDALMMEFLMSDMVFIKSVVQKYKCVYKIHREQSAPFLLPTVRSCVHSNIECFGAGHRYLSQDRPLLLSGHCATH